MTKPHMDSGKPEFDAYSKTYEDLLKDPIRDRFSGASSDFFHLRKRDLIRDYFRRRGINTRNFSYLDLGCGKGELATLLLDDFASVAVCDTSAGMLESASLDSKQIETRVQTNPERIPFGDAQFDFVTAVCVYHHVPRDSRSTLTKEVHRVLRPGGTCAIVEHNPWNPITQLIVSRTPVDADAVLLHAAEARSCLRTAGFVITDVRYFLYLPEKLYEKWGRLESLLGKVPFGGQYAVFASRRLPALEEA